MGANKFLEKMRVKDKVWISFHDIEGIGYGNSVNAEGRIVSADGDGSRFCVEYKEEHSSYMVRKWFYKHDLKKID